MLTKAVAYTYDGLNRMVVRKRDGNGDGTFETTERFVFDGSTEAVLVLDGSGNVTDRLLHGPAIDQVFAEESGSGVVSWLLTDNLGSVRDVARYDSGTSTTSVVDSLDYDSFGKLVTETSSANTPLLKYTGKYLDPDTGNQWNWRRWFKSRIAGWLNPDPSGFTAGDTNLRRYAGNSPTNFTDPTGLWQRATGGPYVYPHGFVGPKQHPSITLPEGVHPVDVPFSWLPYPPFVDEEGDLYWGQDPVQLRENELAIRSCKPPGTQFGDPWKKLRFSNVDPELVYGEDGSRFANFALYNYPAISDGWFSREANRIEAGDAQTGTLTVGRPLTPTEKALAELDPNDPDYWRKYLIVTGNYGLLMLGPDGVAYELAGLGAGAAAGRSQGVRFGYPFGGRGYGRTSPPYTGGPIWPILGGRPELQTAACPAKPSRLVDISKLIPPAGRPFADPGKLRRHGPFDWNKYGPIIVETDGVRYWLMDGMTRVENARRNGITELPAYVYPRSGRYSK